MSVNRGAIAVVAVALSGCTAVRTVDAGLTSFFGNLEHDGRAASELQPPRYYQRVYESCGC
jgi:hypothetical protein